MTKHFFTAMIFLLGIVATVSANSPVKTEENPSVSVSHPSVSESDFKQCGVTNEQIINYLNNLGYIVYWLVDIPGTCNSKAGVQNCQEVTVYVARSSIVGYSVITGVCE